MPTEFTTQMAATCPFNVVAPSPQPHTSDFVVYVPFDIGIKCLLLVKCHRRTAQSTVANHLTFKVPKSVNRCERVYACDCEWLSCQNTTAESEIEHVYV